MGLPRTENKMPGFNFLGFSSIPPSDWELMEINYLFEPETMINICQDRCQGEILARPDIFGFYHDGSGFAHTLAEVANAIRSEA